MRLCIFILVFLPFTAGAQILNIDKTDTATYSPKAKLAINFTTGLEIDKQRTTLYDATNTAEFMLQKQRELLILSSSYRFTYNGPDDILNAGYFHLRYRHNYRHRFQPESFVQYQWDNKRGLLSRTLAGANLRYNFFRKDTWELNAGLGLMYETEKWNYDAVDSTKLPASTLPVTTQYIKLNSYVRLNWKSSESSDLVLSLFLQTRPQFFRPRVAPNVQWNIAAGKHIGFSISVAGIYDAQPVVPINRFYYSMSNGIVVKI